jgi:hypothetical protein
MIKYETGIYTYCTARKSRGSKDPERQSQQKFFGSKTLTQIQPYLVGENVEAEELIQISDAGNSLVIPAVDVPNHRIKD